jgi:tRNA A-37 threonylcarbamoyl transferase component Bud32
MDLSAASRRRGGLAPPHTNTTAMHLPTAHSGTNEQVTSVAQRCFKLPTCRFVAVKSLFSRCCCCNNNSRLIKNAAANKTTFKFNGCSPMRTSYTTILQQKISTNPEEFFNNPEVLEMLLEAAKTHPHISQAIIGAVLQNPQSFINALKDADHETCFSITNSSVFQKCFSSNPGFRKGVFKATKNSPTLHHMMDILYSKMNWNTLNTNTFYPTNIFDCINNGFVPPISIATSKHIHFSPFYMNELITRHQSMQKGKLKEELGNCIERALGVSAHDDLITKYIEYNKFDKPPDWNIPGSRVRIIGRGEEGQVSIIGDKKFIRKTFLHDFKKKSQPDYLNHDELKILKKLTPDSDTVTHFPRVTNFQVFKRDDEISPFKAVNEGKTPRIEDLDGNTYVSAIEMTRAKGAALCELLEPSIDKTIPQGDYSKVASAIVEALRAMHEKNIAHCDLHGGNIMIHKNPETTMWQATIIDFGDAVETNKNCEKICDVDELVAAFNEYPEYEAIAAELETYKGELEGYFSRGNRR